MAYQVTIHEPSRTIIIKGTGQGTTEDTLRLISDSQQLFREHAGYHMLYDAVDLQIRSSAEDMMRVAHALFSAHTAFGRIAVVVPGEREGLARIFAALAEPVGVSTNVFSHVADAWRWLGVAEPPGAER